MLRKVNLYNAMNLGNGQFTCFVADNTAVETYLREKTDYDSVEEMPADEIDFLLRYHIISGAKMASANLMLKLSLPSLTGDYLTAGINIDTQRRVYRQRARTRSRRSSSARTSTSRTASSIRWTSRWSR